MCSQLTFAALEIIKPARFYGGHGKAGGKGNEVTLQNYSTGPECLVEAFPRAKATARRSGMSSCALLGRQWQDGASASGQAHQGLRVALACSARSGHAKGTTKLVVHSARDKLLYRNYEA